MDWRYQFLERDFYFADPRRFGGSPLERECDTRIRRLSVSQGFITNGPAHSRKSGPYCQPPTVVDLAPRANGRASLRTKLRSG
ncbi:hypothetical protein JWS04_34260 [Bradyrhizobium vignae]|uniref:Transposase n=1 Tax=Bradyrhizobium vignae TaxID=1549949 RepID=A0ABS4A6Z2_9BRAD|nr:hypothetical protein [Bradyrhizobium vignae]